MKTICITGVNGFVGSASAVALIEAGYQVVGIDMAAAPAASVHAKVHYQQVDIADVDALVRIFKDNDVQVVYHHAGIKYVGICEAEPERCHAVNFGGTVSILQAMKTASVPHIVFSSTYVVVDATVGRIVQVTEQSLRQPSTVYGKTKALSEEAIEAAKSAGDIDTYHILRYGNVIGRVLPGSFKVESIVDRIVDACLQGTPISLLGTEHETVDGTIARDFVSIKDVVKAHVAVAENSISGIYNIASGQPTTLKQIIQAVEEVTGKTVQVEVKPANPEPDSVTVVSDAAYEAFGWRATTPLIDTVRQLVQIAQETTR